MSRIIGCQCKKACDMIFEHGIGIQTYFIKLLYESMKASSQQFIIRKVRTKACKAKQKQ